MNTRADDELDRALAEFQRTKVYTSSLRDTLIRRLGLKAAERVLLEIETPKYAWQLRERMAPRNAELTALGYAPKERIEILTKEFSRFDGALNVNWNADYLIKRCNQKVITRTAE